MDVVLLIRAQNGADLDARLHGVEGRGAESEASRVFGTPLDVEEGREVTLSIEDAASPKRGLAGIVDAVQELHRAIPPDAWDILPEDGRRTTSTTCTAARRKRTDESGLRGRRLLDCTVESSGSAAPAGVGRAGTLDAAAVVTVKDRRAYLERLTPAQRRISPEG